jgi:hypothetical protein
MKKTRINADLHALGMARLLFLIRFSVSSVSSVFSVAKNQIHLLYG